MSGNCVGADCCNRSGDRAAAVSGQEIFSGKVLASQLFFPGKRKTLLHSGIGPIYFVFHVVA